MTKQPLGTLEHVDLRDYWEREDTEFTPWLADEKNIKLLGDAIGIELEVQAQEANVGPFRADILCRDTSDDSLVLIENQLERTNHNHLGQILTYAAGLDAVTVVWIAAKFTDEHRSAIDWLNRISVDGFHFFGIVVELWRIESSPAAPKLQIVAKPNDWSKAAKIITEPKQMTDQQQMRLEYWQSFVKYLNTSNAPLKPANPKPQKWLGFSIGRSFFRLHAEAVFFQVTDSGIDQHGQVGVVLELTGPESEAHFQLLLAERKQIEKELGSALDWVEKEDVIRRQIRVQRSGDLSRRESWRELHEWTREKLEALDRVFRTRVKNLDASDWQPEDPEEDADLVEPQK